MYNYVLWNSTKSHFQLKYNYVYIYIIIKYLPKIEKTNHLKSSLKYIKMVVNYFDIFCMFP
jgi:hypothetical protein